MTRRKGEPRRLNPNWAGIVWLEQESSEDTEIEITFHDKRQNVMVSYACGYTEARAASHPRRMIDIFKLEVSSSPPTIHQGCPCQDLSRTHPDCYVHPTDWIESLEFEC